MYDLIIIGMGISGISAAIYAKRANLKVLLLDKSAPGGTLNKISAIENYPGITKITGPDFAYNLFQKVNELKIEYKLEEVTDVILAKIKTIKTTSNVYECKNLLIASGRSPRMLGLKDEDKYLGQGISTCALCDGALFKGSDVAVIGGGSSALTEALYLANIVNKVYLIHRKNEFRAENTLVTKLKNNKKVTVILDEEVKELIIDKEKLVGIKLKNKELKVKGLFIYIGFIPNTSFLENTDINMENGYIIVDSKGMTNISGVYASGDVIKKDVYQLINAASEGAIVTSSITTKNNS